MTQQDRKLLIRLQRHLRAGRSPVEFPGMRHYYRGHHYRLGWRFVVKDQRQLTICQRRAHVNRILKRHGMRIVDTWRVKHWVIQRYCSTQRITGLSRQQREWLVNKSGHVLRDICLTIGWGKPHNLGMCDGHVVAYDW